MISVTVRSVNNLNEIPDPNWVAGFVDGEGVAEKKRLVESEVLTAEEAVTPVNLGKVDSSDSTKSSGVKGSLLDDYADTSTEPAVYTGGDD